MMPCKWHTSFPCVHTCIETLIPGHTVICPYDGNGARCRFSPDYEEVEDERTDKTSP